MWGGVWDRAGHSNREKFTFDSAVRGYQVYKAVWKSTIGDKLQADQELGNEVNKFVDEVVQNVKTNKWAIYLASTHKFCGISSHMAERYAWK